METRVAVYLRVSTEQQNHDSQRVELQQHCVRRGWTNVKWFEDKASGATRSREALTLLMEAVRRGKIDVVLAFKLDRLARSLTHLAQIVAELQSHGVALVCPSQGIDTTDSNPCAQFQLNILAAVAQFERDLITERVNAGLVAAKARGTKLGRPYLADHRLTLIRGMLEQGLKTSEISRRLRIPYSSASELVREIKTKPSDPVTPIS